MRFFELVPDPGTLTVDLGTGEGRFGRDLVTRGHRVVAFDASPTMVRAVRGHTDPLPVALADAAALPLADAAADLVVAFMCLHDLDDLGGVITEAGRVLEPGGRLCAAIVHPLNSAGTFEQDGGGAFVIDGSYFEPRRYCDEVHQHGLAMAFNGEHRPLQHYVDAFAAAGFVIEALTEVGNDDPASRWSRIPLFCHLRARRER
ncbi:MAG: methyltransferase domain-containing protein [Actinomycetota bacterium]|nr:methyltransferase domain-containing protein [Actinomycetota bacterium]